MARYYYLMPMLGGPGAPRYPVTETVQLIGRSDKASIPLFEPTVSRRHARLRLDGDEVILKDLGSKHGTFVNSKRINQTRLKVGDIVVIGLSLVLRLEETDKEIKPVETLSVPERMEDTFITAVRSIDEIPSSGRRDVERPEELVERCQSLLPRSQVRLVELHSELRRAVDGGQTAIDPYPILSSVEAVMSTMEPLWEIVGDASLTALTVNLGGTIGEIVEELSSRFEGRGIKFLTKISGATPVDVKESGLRGALQKILHHAGRFSADYNPVEIMTTVSGDRTILMVSILGEKQPGEDDSCSRGAEEIEQAFLALGGEVSIDSRQNIGHTFRISLNTST